MNRIMGMSILVAAVSIMAALSCTDAKEQTGDSTKEKTITVQERVEIDHAGGQFSINVEANFEFQAEPLVDWIAFYTGKLAFHHLHTSTQRQRKFRQAKGIGRQIDHSHKIIHLFFRDLQQGTGIPVDNVEDRKTPSVGQLASMAFRRPEENQIGNQRHLHLFPSIATDTHSPLGWDEMFFPPFLQPVTHGQLMSFPGTGRKPADTFFNNR